jgi:type IV secretion system protein VirD4
LFKEVTAAMTDKATARRVAAIFRRVTEEMAAQEAALDHLQGARDAPDTRQGA